jgi:peptide chain release factor 1
MFDKLQSLEQRYEDLGHQLGDQKAIADRSRYARLSRAFAELEPVVHKFRQYKDVLRQTGEARALAEMEGDEELRALARDELQALRQREQRLEEEMRLLLTPRDPNDDKDVIVEVRAGTGGEEAALFAAEIVRMYGRYADRNGWKVDTVDVSTTGLGGIKEAILNIRGDRVYSRLKFESGVHRVQRVPETEAAGRIHTSAVTVAVLPEAEEVEVAIDEDKDLRIDRFCSSGPGGQSVNTTYSAVRITHLPTGLVVSCQDEKSQIKNKAKALMVLRARLYEIREREQQEKRAGERRSMVGTGDRSEKIRTYNFRDNRVTDHRIGYTVHQLPEFLDGDIAAMIDALSAHREAEKLKESLQDEGRGADAGAAAVS